MSHRSTDGPVQGKVWAFLNKTEAVFAKITPLVSLIVATLAVAVTLYVVNLVINEGKERRDQNCLLFERQAHVAARRLQDTYAYLRTLPRDDYGSSITRAILRNLPVTEADARASVAPEYCSRPGVGLPDLPSDPKIPMRQDFSDRAHKLP